MDVLRFVKCNKLVKTYEYLSFLLRKSLLEGPR